LTEQVMSWSGPEGGRISVGFDDDHFGLEEMQTEMDFMREAHPSLPDKVPGDEHRVLQGEHGTPLGPVQGERYRLQERDRMGPAPLWNTVHLIDQLIHPVPY
jgi:hypothetical protein